MSWEKVTLQEVSISIQTGPFGSQLHRSDYSSDGIPVVMPKDLVHGSISTSSIARVSQEHVNRLARHKIKEGDILYSRRGDVGRCAYVKKEEAGWLCGTGCLRISVNKNKIDSKFLFFQLQQPELVEWVTKHAVGSTMLNLNTNILGTIPIRIPSLHIQKKIAGILSAYDDLIENNNKQIKLLEEAAQRLYKEWFVALRFPGHESTRIVDGVPEGWSRTTLKDIIEIKYGKDHKGIPDGDIPVYGSGGKIRNCSKVLYSGESILIPRKGSLNNILYVDEKFWTVDTMFYSKIKSQYSGIFTYFFIKAFDLYSMNIGAAVPSMTTNILNSLNIILPDDKILQKFHSMVKKYFRKKDILLCQNEKLSQARDRILIKKMSQE